MGNRGNSITVFEQCEGWASCLCKEACLEGLEETKRGGADGAQGGLVQGAQEEPEEVQPPAGRRVVLGGYTAFTLFHNVLFNGTPSPLDKRRHRQELPEEIRSSLAEMQESGVAKTYLELNQIKDAPITLKLVAEEEKRAKDASSRKTD